MTMGNEIMLNEELILHISYVHVCVQEITMYIQTVPLLVDAGIM